MNIKWIISGIGVCVLGVVVLTLRTPSPVLKPSHLPQSPAPLRLHQAAFTHLPEWSTADTRASLQTFKKSCRAFLRQPPQQGVGSEFIALTAQAWQPACRAALTLSKPSRAEARAFFQDWFIPVWFAQDSPITGLFTGYYVPKFSASLVPTAEFSVPIYGLPRDRITLKLRDFDSSLPKRTLVGRVQHNQLVPYYTRKQINQGAIRDVAEVLAWVRSPIDRLFLEIQGSGQLQLTDGNMLYLRYAGGNGAPYTAIGRVLIQRGLLSSEQVSMQSIRAYLEAHPDQMDAIITQNESVVFFERLSHYAAWGSQGVPLTPGYSLAVDKKWVPLGCPVWLETTRPDAYSERTHPFVRLMVAQDTGGAIGGMVRGDVFWGTGEEASLIAGKMKNTGRYWLLLPKVAFAELLVDPAKLVLSDSK